MNTPQELKAEIEVSAPPAKVWSLVTDLPRMASWSPQVVRTVLLGTPVRSGTRFVSLNRHGRLVHWPTSGKVVRFEPHSDFAFRITENYAVWSFHLEPVPGDGGASRTRVTQRREVPAGVSFVSKALTRAALGGQRPFAAELREGMDRTLLRLKAEAEQGS